MGEAFPSLFDAVRAACTPAVWSRGIELTRADAVVGDVGGEGELTFRIATRGGMISPRVRLFPEDAEWECECRSRESACEHVAAAVIAWRRAAEQGTEIPPARVHAGRVAYRFRRLPGGLGLDRVVLDGFGDAQPLLTTLAAVASGRVDGPRFVATQADLAVELALGTYRRGVLPPPTLPRLFAALIPCEDISLDGTPVTVAREPALAHAVLEDQGEGFRLSLEPDPAVSETFGNGIVRCGDVLRIAGRAALTGRESHELAAGRRFSREDAAELVTAVLPSLRGRLHVEVRTRRLPQTAVATPRLVIETSRAGDELSVLATLVYGDPPLGRVDGGRLVPLGGVVPLRDEPTEQRLLRRLARELRLGAGVRATFTGEGAVAFCERLARWDGDVQGGAVAHFERFGPLVPRLTLDGGKFDVSFEPIAKAGTAGAGGRRADAAVVLRAFRAGATLAPLAGGGWAPLPVDWLTRFGHRLADLLAARQNDGTLSPSALPDLARLCEDLDQPAPADLARLRRQLEGLDALPAAKLPEDLTASLRGYQRQGVDWLSLLRDLGMGAMLADDMGLGKTLQALCAMRGRTLVVAPTSVLHNWAAEVARHRPAVRCAIYHGPGRTLDPAADLTLTTYAILRLDADRLAAADWHTVVLDEAQNIKNPESQVAAAAFRLPAAFRITLTGTPVENRLEELWSQFHFINRGLLGGRADFAERYAEPIARGDAGAGQRLRERIRPFLLRRLKSEVAAELPPRTEMVLRCELSADERQVYDAIHAATKEHVVRQLAAGGSVLAALEALLRLRQAACHSALVPGQTGDRSAKLALLLEVLESVVAEGHRALIFSQWTSLLDLAQPHLERAGMPYLRLDGGTRDRAEVVRRFQEDGGPPLMLVSLKAGGTGLNLTAADHIFLLDPWWNPAVEEQAAGRAHRIGQLRPVMVYRLVAEETVEERILALQQHKRELAEVALTGGDVAGRLSREDLLELLA